MNKRRPLTLILTPLLLTVGIVIGILMGKVIYTPHFTPAQQKLMEIMKLIETDYVDSIDTDSLLEENFSQLISLLDPHSAYIPAKDLTTVNEELDGSFSGVGVSFQILNDTVHVIEIVSGGPAEKVGLMAGDCILKADTVDLTGKNATNENVFKNLRGKKGTKVNLTIKRDNSAKPLNFTVTRNDVPVNSVDCSYMVDRKIGYIKVSKFSKTTYQEFVDVLNMLSAEGATQFVVDLRGNSGGYLDQAIQMANEFLPEGRMIVYTKGKNPLDVSQAVANGRGSFQKEGITVLTDEFSASASEVFSGAIQDNDRGVIVGRRTFGKGLVQNQNDLFDGSALRLTVARYYTPSGRSIQKEYKRGESGSYELDLSDRFAHGEFYSADSIKFDKSKIFRTHSGRKVYGGGGIMPDYFVPEDTIGMSTYYISVVNNGMIQKYAYKVANNYRKTLKGVKSIDRLLQLLPRDNMLLTNFVNYAASNGVPARWYYIRQSQQLILHQLKAVIIRDILGYDAFIQYLNTNDKTLNRAIELIYNGAHNSIINSKNVK